MEDRTIREIFYRTILPRLKHQGMNPHDFYGIHRAHNIALVNDCICEIHARLKEILPKKKLCGGFDGAFENGQNNMIDQVLKVLEGELINGK